MGVFSSDGKTRSERRAAAKALKAKAKLEAKLESQERRAAAKHSRRAAKKAHKRELTAERKNARKAAKASNKALKAQIKIAEAQAKTAAVEAQAAADAKFLSTKNVSRYLTVARMVAPILAPVAYRAAVAGRGKIAELQAERAGVAPSLLRRYSGHGAPLAARVTATRDSLEKVAAQDSSADSAEFVAAMTTRLDNLAVAIEAAEPMAPGQRRTAHNAIADELAAIDADILARLGVRA
ncbi:MAG: DUF6474 family protein [Gordonia sp. (in: high G+C Gram-positive bacteria)]